jgi:hypothetical protein
MVATCSSETSVDFQETSVKQILVETLILTLTGCGMNGQSKGEGMEKDVSITYSIASGNIGHQRTCVVHK